MKEEGGTIGDLTETRVEQCGPTPGEFTYVDISSVDRETKRIVAPKVLPSEKAPSRAKQLLKAGDVLVSMTRPNLNAVAIVPPALHGSIGSTGFHVLRAKHAEPRFLFYAVQSRDFVNAMCRKVQGVLYPAVRPEDISSFFLPPFSLPHQRRIVEKIEELFSELDQGIENLQQARAQLAVYRQALLKHAFEGKLTADWRAAHAGELEPACATAEHENDSDIPAGWRTAAVSDIGKIETGTTPPTSDSGHYGGTFPFFKPTDLEQGINVCVARQGLSESGKARARILPKGTTLVTCIGATIGKTGLAKVDCATNQQINSISPSASFIPEFVYYQVTSPRFQDQIKSNASSTTLPILNKGKFFKLSVAVCSKSEQEELVRTLDGQFSVIAALESDIAPNLEKAEALRQSILKKAFSGELVPQDPKDEPASALLARIRAERAAAAKEPKPRGGRGRSAKHQPEGAKP